jgi:hypothetical protein
MVAALERVPMTLEQRAQVGDAFDQLRHTAGEAACWADAQLLAAMGPRRLDRLDSIEGVPAIERHASKARRGWQNDDLRSKAITQLYAEAARQVAAGEGGAVDPGTGERVPAWAEAVEAVAQVWNLSGSNVRLSALKSLGIDPDEYCESGKTKWSLRYVR